MLTSKGKALALEKQLYDELFDLLLPHLADLQASASALAELDVLVNLAERAETLNYCCPTFSDKPGIRISEGRHPVVEQVLKNALFVPNDTRLDCEANRCAIITGPNMAGKSTYMRQNALIAILAQIGSFIPADFGQIGIVDKIFTRVGASDDLTLGKSTFMVEMSETACILNNATQKSLILIDEIGRGTSTYDGVAIAWSVAEYIASKIGARCIFATHYHELNVMTKTFPQIKNYRITISEENGEIEFLRKIVPGGASKSYGIQVAKMAGLPNSVVKRSEELMSRMQRDFSKNLSKGKSKSKAESELEIQAPQLNLFGE